MDLPSILFNILLLTFICFNHPTNYEPTESEMECSSTNEKEEIYFFLTSQIFKLVYLGKQSSNQEKSFNLWRVDLLMMMSEVL